VSRAKSKALRPYRFHFHSKTALSLLSPPRKRTGVTLPPGQLTPLTPVTVGSTTAVVTADTVFTLSASNSTGTVSRSVPVCVAAAPVSVALTTPASYGCGDSFQGELVLTNGSCYEMRVDSITLSFALNACPIPGGPWRGGGVSPGSWAPVLSGPNGSICCATSPCSLHCSDTAIWTLSTTAGTLTASAPFTVDLENCNGQLCQ